MEIYAHLAYCFTYPEPDSLERIRVGLYTTEQDLLRSELEAFFRSVSRLSLAEWEELYTRTLDLNPSVAPYIGFQMWGESYQRGTFMAALNRAMADAGIDTRGELPDHLEPVLRYLAAASQPLAELLEILPGALARMIKVLGSTEADNPYMHLFKAVQILIGTLVPGTQPAVVKEQP